LTQTPGLDLLALGSSPRLENGGQTAPRLGQGPVWVLIHNQDYAAIGGDRAMLDAASGKSGQVLPLAEHFILFAASGTIGNQRLKHPG
jgi:hypothetical protein